MKKFIIKKDKENINVLLLKNKLDDSYSYVNLSKGHICSCKFNSIDDAIEDMIERKNKGLLIDFWEYE